MSSIRRRITSRKVAESTPGSGVVLCCRATDVPPCGDGFNQEGGVACLPVWAGMSWLPASGPAATLKWTPMPPFRLATFNLKRRAARSSAFPSASTVHQQASAPVPTWRNRAGAPPRAVAKSPSTDSHRWFLADKPRCRKSRQPDTACRYPPFVCTSAATVPTLSFCSAPADTTLHSVPAPAPRGPFRGPSSIRRAPTDLIYRAATARRRNISAGRPSRPSTLAPTCSIAAHPSAVHTRVASLWLSRLS
jgi:hypothetical protein